VEDACVTGGSEAEAARVMRCAEVRPALHDYQEGRLPLAEQPRVRAHLDGCADCTYAAAVEAELTSVLERTLPQHAAPLALKRRLAASRVVSAPPRPRSSWGWRPALAAAALLLVVGPLVYLAPPGGRASSARSALAAEAVNDHLRVLASDHPLSVASGGLHQVKPWFEGRLDFAPIVAFEGDADFPLRGGAIGYFMDRKSAIFVYGHRLHNVSLFVFRAEGLAWPGAPVTTSQERGFTVILWQRDRLGYALVSDVETTTLNSLADRLRAGG
jgi:anti-sigma factor RsiW